MGHFVLQGVLDHYTMYKTAFSKKLNFLKIKALGQILSYT